MFRLASSRMPRSACACGTKGVCVAHMSKRVCTLGIRLRVRSRPLEGIRRMRVYGRGVLSCNKAGSAGSPAHARLPLDFSLSRTYAAPRGSQSRSGRRQFSIHRPFSSPHQPFSALSAPPLISRFLTSPGSRAGLFAFADKNFFCSHRMARARTEPVVRCPRFDSFLASLQNRRMSLRCVQNRQISYDHFKIDSLLAGSCPSHS
jgi:hypothetical protein